MKNILILGAGLSTYVLIENLLKDADKNDWYVKVGDVNLETAQKSVQSSSRGTAIKFDVLDDNQLDTEIKDSDIVVSMLPARFHLLPAKKCVKYSKPMVTASYTSPEMSKLHNEALDKGILLLNEVGLDPGIDHMSAMQIIEKLKEQGAEITEYRSFTGGLVAPEYDNNPWNYKLTWNPRNVVLAGQGTAQILVNQKYKYIPYNKLFERKTTYNILDYGEFEGYPNRDSLKYRESYGLQNIKTMVRGTLRRPGFCDTWNVFVQLGVTDDTYELENVDTMTYRQFINSYLPLHKTKTVEEKLAEYLNLSENSYILYRLRWLGIFEKKLIGLKKATPAQILQKLLEEKWKLNQNDKDMIVMQHIFNYQFKTQQHRLKSSMVVEGKDKIHTAMAMTVGTPVAIATKLILTEKIKTTGVQIPNLPEIYEEILKELAQAGIKFIEEDEIIQN